MTLLARVRGTIEEKRADGIILFVGGLGLEIQAPLSTLGALPDTGEEVTLRTYLQVREGALGLYGFLSEAEQQMFELLLSVSGVGPRAALNCLSLLSVEQLAGAIAGADGESLRRVPGVGRKTADRILLELKGRLAGLEQTPGATASPSDSTVIEVLLQYGRTQAEAVAAVASLPKDRLLSEEERILLALQYFAPKAEPRRRDG